MGIEKIKLARRYIKVARKLLTAVSGPFNEDMYDELRKKDEDELVRMLLEYVGNIEKYAEVIRKKNIGYVTSLQSDVANLESKLEQGMIQFDEYSRKMKKLEDAIERKSMYAKGEFPDALDYKNYGEKEYKFVDAVMRQGGYVREILAALAFIKTKNEKVVSLATRFCTYMNGLLNNDGLKLRAILSKQSGNRQPYHALLKAVPKRTRMKQACENAENCTREIMADLVNANGKVVAHIGFINHMAQRIDDKGDELDSLNFENNHGTMASRRTAGFLDDAKAWLDKTGNFFEGLFNKFVGFCKGCYDSIASLFRSTDKYKEIADEDAEAIEREFKILIKALKG